ncbi:hypothetical protein EON67_07665, partial [archaeon]
MRVRMCERTRTHAAASARVWTPARAARGVLAFWRAAHFNEGRGYTQVFINHFARICGAARIPATPCLLLGAHTCRAPYCTAFPPTMLFSRLAAMLAALA